MGGACLKPVFCIRTQSGLTVQLHQILPISMRLQGLYKHCSPHRDNAFPSFPLMVSGPTHAFLSQTLTHTFLHALCGIDLHLELVQREADVRVKSQNSLSSPTTWANAARWSQFCNEDNTAIIKSSKKTKPWTPRPACYPISSKLTSFYWPCINNHSAQVGFFVFLLFYSVEDSSGQTWNRGKLPRWGPGARTFPPFCLLRSESFVSLWPTGPSRPALSTTVGFRSCLW